MAQDRQNGRTASTIMSKGSLKEDSVRSTKNKPPRINVFWVALGAGFLLGVLLLIQGFLTYTYVMNHLVPDHLTGEATFHVAQIENRARRHQCKHRQGLPRHSRDTGPLERAQPGVHDSARQRFRIYGRSRNA